MGSGGTHLLLPPGKLVVKYRGQSKDSDPNFTKLESQVHSSVKSHICALKHDNSCLGLYGQVARSISTG